MSSSVGPVFTRSLSITFASPTPTPPGGGGSGGGGQGGQSSANGSNNSSLASSASLYLYTFLATLVLLLAVSGAIVVRSFILRRRNRRMVEEAIRNGTWVPPAPPVRAARVDLSKKPELWEAYLGDGGWQLGSLGHGSGKELEKFDYSRDWESIKPISASYAAPLTSVPCSGSPPNFSSISPPVPIPARRDDEENQRTPEVSTGTTTSLLSRARLFLHHHPTPIFPTSTSSSADNGTQAHSNSTNISLTELSSNSPPTVRVAVLIAMPSLSSHGSSTTTASLSSSLSPKAQPTTSHHPQSSPSSTLKFSDDEEFPLPHLEMGIAEVTIGRSENSSSWDSTHAKGEVKTYSRGSSYAEP